MSRFENNFWICHSCKRIYEIPYGKGFRCPNGCEIDEIESLDDDQEEIYKIAIKQGAIDELKGIINILEQYKNDKLPAKSFIQFYNKRLKELER
jgi:hypothetical protein